MPMHPDPITRLNRACEPSESLMADDPRFVNCDDVRGENVVAIYARSLRRADPTRPEIKLFAGHRGIGKTCELHRLKALLESETPPGESYRPFQVVYIDVEGKLDLNDLDLPDLMIYIAAEVLRQLKAADIPGFDPVTTKMKGAWDDIKGLLGAKTSIGEVGVDVGFLSMSFELKNRANSRQVLRDAIELHATNLLDAVNDLLGEANVKLRKQGKEGLVLIVDGMERMVRRPLEGIASNTHDRLFIDRSEQLASLRAHTIYTVPISLFYSTRCAHLEQTFGEHNFPVPMIRLHEPKEEKIDPESPGMRKMREIVEARCRYAQIEYNDLFDAPETENYLCEKTGGHPRHLLMFLQAALNTLDKLPITKAAAEKAVQKYANSLVREIPDAYWKKLRQFDKPKETYPKDEAHQDMLFLLHVFEYMNGRPWYEINPVIRTLPEFRRH